MIPVIVLTGFLGSGKTSLLNRLLAGNSSLRDTALIINEFGDIGIDHALIERAEDEIIELSNGCVCCSLRGDFIEAAIRLMKRKKEGEKIERIILETTGLCDPAPVAQAIIAHPELSAGARLHKLVAMVDARAAKANLDAYEEAVKQVACADLLMISKTDIAPFGNDLKNTLARLNPAAPIAIAQDCGQKELIDHIAGGSFADDFSRLKSAPPEFTSLEFAPESERKTSLERLHDIESFTLQSDKSVKMSRLAEFLDLLGSLDATDLLRVKGIARVYDSDSRDDERVCVIHGVQGVFSAPVFLPPRKKGAQKNLPKTRLPKTRPPQTRAPKTRLVLIARRLTRKRAQTLFDALMQEARTDSPDFAALSRNPLAFRKGD